jgi:DNA-binding SARP family transcriptional activator/tetratricopeptide (TPR) repeat protein
MRLSFAILGPPEVWADGRRVGLGGPRSERLLAVLLLSAGRVVSLDRLTEGLWDGEPPPTAKHQIHKVIAGLRRALPAAALVTDGPGYRLRLDGASLDAALFEEHLARAHRDEAAAEGELRAALALWRGPALAGVEGLVVRAAAAGLDERRLSALERHLDLRLADGAAAEIAAELPALVAEHPLREGLRGRLMLALHRCGRQAEALAVYAEGRRVLAEEAGLDPGAELVRLHAHILRDPVAPAATRCALPYDVPDFTGRAADLDRLLALAADDALAIAAIDGMAGVGKTTLAVHAAHRLAGRYPDGQLYVDLHGHAPGRLPLDPAAALEMLLRMLDVPAEQIPDGLERRAARWRVATAGRRVLVVLDNAADAGQVRPLLPGSAGCCALVTSRRRLGVLDGATGLSLDVLPPTEALDLFGTVAGPGRVLAEPAAAAEVVRLCGHLPLAIRIAATRLTHRSRWTVLALATRLRDERGRLAELAVGDRCVEAAFALSYRQLDGQRQRLFRLLGGQPCADLAVPAAAALAGLPERATEDALEELVDAHLLQQQAPGRYRFHDLLREYAAGLSTPDGDAVGRLLDHYLGTATAAADRLEPELRRFEPVVAHRPAFADQAAALAWLEAERGNLMALVRHAAGAGRATHAWQLACVLRPFFERRGYYDDWRGSHEAGLRAARAAGDRRGATLALFNLGALGIWTGAHAGAEESFRQVLAGEPDPRLEAAALCNLGMMAHLAGRNEEAVTYLHRGLAANRVHGDRRAEANLLNNLGLATGRLGRAAEGLRWHRRAMAVARGIGNPQLECAVFLGLGETSHLAGAHADALEHHRSALAHARNLDTPFYEAMAHDGIAHALHATGDRAAGGHWRRALAVFTALRVAHAAEVRRHLDSDTADCFACRQPAPAVR